MSKGKRAQPPPEPLRVTPRASGQRLAVFVGDHEIDAETALAAGMQLILHVHVYRQAPVEQLPHAARR